MQVNGKPFKWFILPGLLALVGCQQKNEFVAPPPPQVTVSLPVEQEVQEYYSTTGQTRASKTVVLRARVSGYLQEIHFRDGDLVEKGQLLYLIDPAPYEAEVASAQAAQEKASAQLLLAEQNLKRTKELAAKKVATANELDIQEAEVATSKADLGAAEARLQEAKLSLSYTKITAPFAGRIGHHMVDIGNLIQIGETTLAKIEATDPIYAYFTISEADLLRFLEMAQKGEIKISEADPLRIELALGDSSDFEFEGKLDFREFGVDPETGTTERRAVFDNTDGGLIPGLFVRVRGKVGDPAKKLLVPEEAIGSDQRGDFLRVVNEKNIVEHRAVETGILVDGKRVIESGLKPDDRVVVVGLQRAQPGKEVNPEDKTPETSAKSAVSQDTKTENKKSAS
ncbi:efflux RND transporter periplasmic adaptor subunit [Gimesia sp.]|uniref:efflux RND transporter periplasmic adaptor subunit n=1 Tax=Gimesia sp. TaxID=2024833 RepID=UPI000C5EA726|nr:efflux RND transporter periplasmic adaptor subunit [Gimesia sp.]MAX38937.1 efflux transporter periplasmic adaptor subunit [Gimesia sp.]HAH49186.1 efflux transporter periplasmic adaptor subunit [Planctomycetaceae bacterium]HBL45822.1 efflux transporter periplasmic adaptor subunit [Planctomycetaceae bacterium]|tara:strand:+ start:2049 stop:3239 length:1191 start_codon:yes stop_codon:yes gene_type:complete